MQQQGLSKTQIIAMSITTGICVANIYYNQPILNLIAQQFRASESEVGQISVLAQAGYGLGLFLLAPLGDRINRRTLILTLQLLLITTLIGIVLAPNLGSLYILSLLNGMFSVAAQVILPMAAALSAPANRGKTVGTIVTGLLIGILSARVFSGYISQWLGWRYVYGISAGLVLVSTMAMRSLLPNTVPAFKGHYASLLKSTVLQLKRFPLLRYTAVLGAFVFGCFCSFWTTLTFHLSGEPFEYTTGQIGLFGIIAIAGALLAPVFGKLADKGHVNRSLRITVGMVLFSILTILAFPTSLIAFVLAVLLLDVGVQAAQVSNIATIYSLDETAHSRINTIYMTSYFIGGSLGTFAGVQCWHWGGYSLVLMQLLLWSLIAFILVMFRARVASRSIR